MIYSRDDEAIIAQCTPHGSGALALLRLSGVNAFEIAQNMILLANKQALSNVPSHTVHVGYIKDTQGNTVDQIMVIAMRGPKTFTGQDTIEITCHGNQLIVEAIIAQAIASGARLAGPGEFSQRAFLNKKIDLLQAEAINDLIHAQTEAAIQKSLSQLEGTFSQWVHDIEQGLIKALAWCEASFEFLDEEAEFGPEIKTHLEQLLTTIEQLKTTYNVQQQVRQGVRIALIGMVNAGKSSLFNALLQTKRAIVSSAPGTTRDTIEAGFVYQGNQWTFIDTAGIRTTSDSIEQEGIKRSQEEAHKADIIILVIDRSQSQTPVAQQFFNELTEQYPSKIIVAYTKTDAEKDPAAASSTLQAVETSSITGQGINTLRAMLNEKTAAILAAHQSPFLINTRHYRILLKLETQIAPIVAMLSEPSIHYELVSFHLKQALESLTELTGKSVSEAALDTVFKEFCVGK
jgi:tRNA modification GTPase